MTEKSEWLIKSIAVIIAKYTNGGTATPITIARRIVEHLEQEKIISSSPVLADSDCVCPDYGYYVIGNGRVCNRCNRPYRY